MEEGAGDAAEGDDEPDDDGAQDEDEEAIHGGPPARRRASSSRSKSGPVSQAPRVAAPGAAWWPLQGASFWQTK